MMKTRHVLALLRLELQQAAGLVWRTFAMAFGLAAVLALLGSSAALLVFAMLLAGLGTMVIVPNTVMRDRFSCGFEFLLGLPVPAETIVAARFASAGVLSFVAALALQVAVVVSALPTFGVPALALFPGIWLGLFLMACLWIALMIRLDPHASIIAPLIVAIAVGAIVEKVHQADPTLFPGLLRRLAQPAMAVPVSVLLFAAAIGAIAGAFLISVRALERYRPDRDGIGLAGKNWQSDVLRRASAR